MSDLFLEIIEGPGKGGGYRLLSDTALVGRGADCDIKLDNAKGVSRQHCRLYVQDGTLRIQDLGSQNGVIINGKKIADAIIKPGVAFKVGESVLALRREEPTIIKSAIARQVDSGEMAGMAPAGNPTINAPAPAPVSAPASSRSSARAPAMPSAVVPGIDKTSNIEQAQELMEAAGRGSKSLLLGLAVIVAIIFGGFYLVHMLSLTSPRSRSFVIVKSGQEKAVDLGGQAAKAVCKDTERGRRIVNITPYKGLLHECLTETKFANNPQLPRRTMAVVRGDQEGEGWLELFSANGTAVGRKRIVCRGVKRREYSPDIQKKDAIEKAQKAALEGKVFSQDERYYDAWQKFRLAEELSIAAQDAAVAGEYGMEATANRTKLRNELIRRFNDALATAFPANLGTSRPDFDSAIMQLDQAKILIPDEESVDRQVIENWQLIIASEKRKKKK